VIKDGSYDANVYTISFSHSHLHTISTRRISAQFDLQYEQRYFQTNNVIDQYHYARDDYIFNTKFKLGIILSEKLEMQLNSRYTTRNTSSPFSIVRRDKKFESFESGLNFEFSILN